MTPHIKVCGVIDLANAVAVAQCGVAYLGLNFWTGSKRNVELDRATTIAKAVRTAGASCVGLFVNASVDEIAYVLQRVPLGALQLHGEEPPAMVAALRQLTPLPIWKAHPVVSPFDPNALTAYGADAYVLDAPSIDRGGSGTTWTWSEAQPKGWATQLGRIIVAGGLTPANVREAIAAISPWAVDVASGVEEPDRPGIKALAKVAAFVAAVRA